MSVGEVDEEAIEPLPPPGLSRLTAAQQSLAESLQIDPDLLSAAGLAGQQAPDLKNGDAKLDAWIAELPTKEKAVTLKLLLSGAGSAQRAARRLTSCFLAWPMDQQPIGNAASKCQTIATLRKSAMSAAQTRKQQEPVQKCKVENA